MKFWIAVVSQEHAKRALEGQFIQACHGKRAPLVRMKKGDGVLIYSSKISMNGTEKCQCFTAIGEVIDDEIYSFPMTEDFIPFRRNIRFVPAQEISILALIPHLSFITNKKSWGYPFRFGFLEIPEADFKLIQKEMLDD